MLVLLVTGHQVLVYAIFFFPAGSYCLYLHMPFNKTYSLRYVYAAV